MWHEADEANHMSEPTELAQDADFSIIRYAQCWEDADVMLEALDVGSGDVCVSIASAGDNTLSLLTRNPAKVMAVDLSPVQMACLEIRTAAYRELSHQELLQLMGVRESTQRLALYARLRPSLSARSRALWDRRKSAVAAGIGNAGKFENYLGICRRYLLPLTHSRQSQKALMTSRSKADRYRFYAEKWNNWRWRFLLSLFCSRSVMGRLGRDPRFFNFVEGSVAARIAERVEYALTELDPAQNPYLQWIVFGTYRDVLPHALRPENFDVIRRNIDRLACHVNDIESFLSALDDDTVDRFNLSDVFEYLPEDACYRIFEEVARTGRKGGRVAYWNMLVSRRRPEFLAAHLEPLSELSERLHRAAKAFFYSAFVVEEIH